MAIKPAHLTIAIGLFILSSCTALQYASTNTTSRTIILDNDLTISEREVGKFICWQCKDFVNLGRTVVEVGFFESTKLEGVGFVLYDGGNTGASTQYRRTGLEHRWDWGPNSTNYSFVIQPDGTGLYYDFTSVPEGESTKAKDVYKCFQRK